MRCTEVSWKSSLPIGGRTARAQRDRRSSAVREGASQGPGRCDRSLQHLKWRPRQAAPLRSTCMARSPVAELKTSFPVQALESLHELRSHQSRPQPLTGSDIPIGALGRSRESKSGRNGEGQIWKSIAGVARMEALPRQGHRQTWASSWRRPRPRIRVPTRARSSKRFCCGGRMRQREVGACVASKAAHQNHGRASLACPMSTEAVSEAISSA